jgi:quinohemoprotein ethanol dehydrogenase
MQAPKNGFFFILDRATGEFLSAEPYSKVKWATGYDKNGRPIEAEGARYTHNKIMQIPAAVGAHNWHSMSYNPFTGLMYIPVLNSMMEYSPTQDFSYKKGHFNLGSDIPSETLFGPRFMQMLKDKVSRGELVAWDPVKQQRVWAYKHKRTWNGGTLATAGGLVFQGTADQQFMAFDASTGDVLWQQDVQLGVIAAPVSYRVNGEQYIAINAKWGGAAPMAFGLEPMSGLNNGRLLVFKLNGNAVLPEVARVEPKRFTAPPPPMTITDKQALTEGKKAYSLYCATCHGDGGVSGGITPDLRHMDAAKHAIFNQIVLDGLLQTGGMVSFRDVLDEQSAEQVRNYILSEAHTGYEEQQAFDGSWWSQVRLWWYDILTTVLAWLGEHA